MKKKAAIIISAILIVALLGSGAASMLVGRNGGNNTDSNAGKESEATSSEEEPSLISGAEEMINDNDASGDESAADPDSGTSDPESETTVPADDEEPSNEESGRGSGGSGGSGDSSENSDSDSAPQDPQGQSSAEEESEIPTISFPYNIPETNLVIQKVSAYNGYFIEDASDREISGIAAIVLVNNGGDLEFAGIGIAQGKRNLAFSASQIPAGATVIIQEQSGAEYTSDPYYSATATTQPVDHFEMSEDLVTLKDNGDNTLSVTNISGEVLPKIKVYFKNYMSDEDIYVGGITYSITLEDIDPDTITDVSASHYDSQYSKVVKVTVER